jgi:hypothetical protein
MRGMSSFEIVHRAIGIGGRFQLNRRRENQFLTFMRSRLPKLEDRLLMRTGDRRAIEDRWRRVCSNRWAIRRPTASSSLRRAKG